MSKVKKISISTGAILFLLVLIVAFMVYKVKPVTGKAELKWNPNTESDLAGYKIYYGTSKRTGSCPSGGYENKVDVGNDAKYEFTNLENGKTYYFSITSYDNNKNESCFSPEISKFINRVTFFEKIKLVFQKVI